jgi:hypothetical protein
MGRLFLSRAATKPSGEATLDDPSLCYQDSGRLTPQQEVGRERSLADLNFQLADQQDTIRKQYAVSRYEPGLLANLALIYMHE